MFKKILRQNIQDFFKVVKNKIPTKKNLVAVTLAITLCVITAYYFWHQQNTCRGMVETTIKQGVLGLRKESINHVKNACYDLITKAGDYRELYAYYKLYKYVDDLNNDKGQNDIYYWMLFYANQNSREFSNERGLYEQELKDLENHMTQEEKIKSFSYVADNIVTGNEGWVKKHDYQKSFEYLKKAAEAGDNISQRKLGECYFAGSDFMNKIEIPKNLVESYKWIYISTLYSEQKSYFYDYANRSLKVLEKSMNSEQIKKSTYFAEVWLKQNSEFVESHPLKIIGMTHEEVKLEQEKTKKFIKEYNLDKSL